MEKDLNTNILDYRIGFGYDVHKLVEGRELIIGGIKIEHEKGLLGHSDADLLCHSISDALFGSLALGDIGTHFPDTNPKYKGINSIEILKYAYSLVKSKGYFISNIDSTIIAQRPKLMPFIPKMRENIANALELEIDRISIKATTSEKMGFIGREEGINCQSVVLVMRKF